MKVSVHGLRAFLKVTELGSFTGAAAALGVTQPSLSRSIRATEDALGVRLFDRHTRSLELTPAGVAFRKVAGRIATEMDDGLAEFSSFLKGRSGRVTIATLPSVVMSLLPGIMRTFMRLHPDVAVEIRDGPQEPTIDDIRRGKADFAIAMRPPADEDLTFQPIFEDEFRFVCAADGPIPEDPVVAWSIFRTVPFIALARGSSIRSTTDEVFRSLGLDVVPHLESGYPETVLGLVSAGLGMTALPRLTLSPHRVPAIVILPIHAPVASRSMGIVRLHGRTASPAAQRFMDLLAEAAARGTWTGGQMGGEASVSADAPKAPQPARSGRSADKKRSTSPSSL
jgi:LysR family transcriptional regulator, carnitine catabolism transcriptional activator